MAKGAKAESPQPDSLDLISRLLALHLIKGMESDEAALQLGAAGFDDKTVSQMVGVSESSIRGLRFRRTKKTKKAKKKK